MSFEVGSKNRKTFIKQKESIFKKIAEMVLFSGYFAEYNQILKELYQRSFKLEFMQGTLT